MLISLVQETDKEVMKILHKKIGNYLAALPFVLSVACAEQDSEFKKANTKDHKDEDLTAPSEISGSFVTTDCKFIGGALTCTVKYADSLIDLNSEQYGLSPNYSLFQSKELSSDTPEKLESSGAFSIEASSMPETGSGATFSFSFLNISFMNEMVQGKNQLSAEEKRSNSVGQIFTYSSSDYSPPGPKKFVTLNRCVLGILLDTWLTGEDSKFAQVKISPDDLKNFPYLGSDATVLAEAAENRWNKSISMIIDTFINEAPADVEAYTCSSDYEKIKSGEKPKVLLDLEKQVGELIFDYLFEYKGFRPPIIVKDEE